MIAFIDANKNQLAPCHPALGRKLLREGKAAVFKQFPFTLILKRAVADVVKPTFVIKIDPGSKVTGIAIVNQATGQIVFACELTHRGELVKENLEKRAASRRSRRNRKTRYRKPRFLNRTRPAGWLPPSLESRLSNTFTWVNRLAKVYPIAGLAVESVKFDIQLLENPEITGVEYQQGTLAGYEVREYLLCKFGRKCCYCKAENVPLQIEHIVPRSRKGSNRIWNLCLACESCNQRKGTQTAAEFGFPKLHEQARASYADAAAVNSARKKLLRVLEPIGLPIETGSGGLTKFNRTKRNIAKSHWADAACVGSSTPEKLILPVSVLQVQATGHGSRQMCRTNKKGFPVKHLTRNKTFRGWQTGDIARAVVPKGVHKGTFTGRLTIRQTPTFAINKKDVHLNYLTRLHRRDGYGYQLLRADKQTALAHSTHAAVLVGRDLSP